MRSRGWCFTVNNWTDDDLAYLMDQELLQYRYLVIGFEIGEKEGTPHLQGYVYYDNARWTKAIRKMYSPWHVEDQKGPTSKAIQYCIEDCDNDFYEQGRKPDPTVVDKAKIDEVMANPWSNFHLFNMYRKSYEYLQTIAKKQHHRILRILPEEQKYNFQGSVTYYPSEWTGEEVYVFYPGYQPEWLDDWLHGWPRKERVGYEYKTIDPHMVILLYSGGKTDKDYLLLRNKFSSYNIDGEIQIGLPKEEVQENESSEKISLEYSNA